MSVIVEVTVPADEFALPETTPGTETGTFRAVRLVAHESGRVMPFLWADCNDVDRLCEEMREDPSVSDLGTLAAFDGQCLLRVEWEPRVRTVISAIREAGAIVLGVSGSGGVWRLRIYCPDYNHVTATRERCEAHDVDVTFEAESRLSGGSGHFGLTEPQYEAVVSAYELGYYDVPRAVTQGELADRFGVTHQALSERLRRAHETLVANGLDYVANQRDRSVSPRAYGRVDI